MESDSGGYEVESGDMEVMEVIGGGCGGEVVGPRCLWVLVPVFLPYTCIKMQCKITFVKLSNMRR